MTNKLFNAINQLLIALIIGVVTVGVSFIGDMSRNLQVMATSVEQLNIKMSQVYDRVQDHETRIRHMEGKGAQ